MPSSIETRPEKATRRRFADVFEIWNRKAHFYLGLYFLLFVWLFSLTGLLLNHPKWTFAQFWPTRKQTAFDKTIVRPPEGSDLPKARDIMRQIGVVGEIEWTATRADSDRLDFRATRPGEINEIKTDIANGIAHIQRIELNTWGVMHVLHTFTGVRMGDSRNNRDWVLTSVWSVAMDAVAFGLIVMTLGSYYMWLRLPRKRLWGAVALSIGWCACGWFVFGLGWFFA
jgi:hypothetical protein